MKARTGKAYKIRAFHHFSLPLSVDLLARRAQTRGKDTYLPCLLKVYR
jgi:hypothetical protein